MDWAYASAPNGNVVQTGRTALDGVKRKRMTLVLGFGAQRRRRARHRPRRARDAASTAPRARYAGGWHRYLGAAQAAGRRRARGLAHHLRRVGDDARRPRGQDLPRRLRRLAEHAVGVGPGPLEPERRLPQGVVARPLPDRHRAARGRRPRRRRTARSTTCSTRQQKPDGCFPQNSNVDGTEHWTNLQLDEVAFPIVLAWQLGRRDAGTYEHVKAAVGCILANGPADAAGALGEPGRLVAGHDRVGDRRARHRRRHRARQRRTRPRPTAWEAKADEWQAKVEDWTVTTTGPYSAAAVLPAHHQGERRAGSRPERRHDLQHRRLGPRGRRPAQGHRPELPRARAPRRQARRRPDDPQHARRRRPAARRRHAQRPLLAPLQLRRLRREEGRRDLGRRAARQPDARTGRTTRRSGASGRSSPASAASTSSPPGQPDAARGRLAAMAARRRARAT